MVSAFIFANARFCFRPKAILTLCSEVGLDLPVDLCTRPMNCHGSETFVSWLTLAMADFLSGLAQFPSLSKRWPRNCSWLFLNYLGFRVAPAVSKSGETALQLSSTDEFPGSEGRYMSAEAIPADTACTLRYYYNFRYKVVLHR